MAAAINTLSAFCGARDVPALTREQLDAHYGWDQADVVILFGGSLLSGVATLAAAMRANIARTTMIVGGEGHTTSSLRAESARALSGSEPAGTTEAEIFQHHLGARFGLQVDLLERESTNCGNNVTNALRILEERTLPHDRVVLIQDATMQRRMSAGWQHADPGAEIVNFAAGTAHVTATDDGELRFANAPDDMWPMERFVSMLLGEVRRLRDDDSGYGPRGTGWVVHVDIPPAVAEAAALLGTLDAFAPGSADPKWSSR
ncbi:hypothetical protein ACQ143_06890 [Microbacterium sp. MC2]